NQVGPALGYYDQAMAAGELDKNILDNVAEALHALPESQRDGALAKRVQRRFAEQDPRLQAKLREHGLNRWGGTWVNDEELERLRAQKQEMKDRLEELERDFHDVEAQIQRIDDDIDSNRREMRRLAARAWVRDNEGRAVRTTLPGIYYDIKRDNDRLEVRRRQLEHRLGDLRRDAKGMAQQIPEETYTGTQHLIGPEGMPILIPPAAPAASARRPGDATQEGSTQPATAPLSSE
ncbi:MAG: hypothetical protein ACREIT_12005, partial [Tepidisphaeraceae bacterium]